MGVPSLFEYIYYSLRYPSQRNFISMGYGIQERYVRNKLLWDKHLNNSKAFLRENINSEVESSVMILGSGRLLDVPADIFDSISEVVLVDADPVALKKSAGKLRAKRLHVELSGSIQEWSRSLTLFIRSSRKTENQIAEFLRTLRILIIPELPKSDVVISLNILGQIPVYWRQIVQDTLKRHVGITTGDDGEFSEPIRSALDESCRLLQSNHINFLSSHATKKIILLTDCWYHYYQKEIAPWETYPALYLTIPEHLEGLSCSRKESWLWHIAPQGIEDSNYGVIHEVNAYAFL